MILQGLTGEALKVYAEVCNKIANPAPGVYRLQPDFYLHEMAKDVIASDPDPVEWLQGLLAMPMDGLLPRWDDLSGRWVAQHGPVESD